MDKRKIILIVATILSLLFHVGIIILINSYDWLRLNAANLDIQPPVEIPVTLEPLPKEKPKEIVENQNFNKQTPKDSKYLSDENSIAANEQKTEKINPNTPYNKGNVPFKEFSQANGKVDFKPQGYKRFSSKALTGKQVDWSNDENGKSEQKNEGEEGEASVAQNKGAGGTGQQYDQRDFSVEELGGMTLSTYKWDWAPWIHKFKQKHRSVWFPPAAFTQLGLIEGRTIVYIEVSRDGQLLDLKVLDHKGHESLEECSVNSLKATFPFIPLPDDFPDKTLKLTVSLSYILQK